MSVVRTLRVRVDRVQFPAARQVIIHSVEITLKPETKEKLIFLAICFGLVFLLYGISLFGDFVFDDFVHCNLRMSSPANIAASFAIALARLLAAQAMVIFLSYSTKEGSRRRLSRLCFVTYLFRL